MDPLGSKFYLWHLDSIDQLVLFSLIFNTFDLEISSAV